MNRLVFGLVIVVLASACNQTHYEKEIKRIDSLFVAMDEAEAQFRSLDSVKIAEYCESSAELLSNFDQSVEDTLDLETAVLVSDYAYVKKVLKKFEERKDDIEKDLVFNRKQLTRLKSDLEHNAIPNDSVEYYLNSETNAVNSLNNLAVKTVENVNMQIERYDSLHPLVVNIAKEYISKVEATQ